MDTTCIITGLYLISPDKDEWVAADLFLQGETLIVYASTHQSTSGQTAWHPFEDEEDKICTFGLKALFLGTEFFERRGVFVINREDCELSHEAIAYVIKNGGKDIV